MNKLFAALGAIPLTLAACTASEPVVMDRVSICVEPRPQVCTLDYNPVCATRDNGIRCVATPCASTETATYANACGACADPAVIAYKPGPCAE